MIDFSTLKGLTIPEGVVTEIADESGAVLWSASNTAKVTITSVCKGINGETSWLRITSPEPFNPYPNNPNWGTTTSWFVFVWEEPNKTIELPIGATIECMVEDTKASERCYVELNGVEVLSETGTYVYTVNGDVTIHMEDKYEMGEYGWIIITDGAAPGSKDDTASVTIISECRSVDGDTAKIRITSSEPFNPFPSSPNWSDTSWFTWVSDEYNGTFEVSIGTTIECTIVDKEGSGYVTVVIYRKGEEEGVPVLYGAGTYVYTVNGDIEIGLSDDAAGTKGFIYIEEKE